MEIRKCDWRVKSPEEIPRDLIQLDLAASELLAFQLSLAGVFRKPVLRHRERRLELPHQQPVTCLILYPLHVQLKLVNHGG